MKKAALTRLSILQKAFQLIYTRGYQATSIDDILATTKVTKGAFYYHFSNKDEMGIAIIEEILKPGFHQNFIEPLNKATNPLEAIYKVMENVLLHNDQMKVEFGCPASNLTQEMTPWNSDFSVALNELTASLEKAMTKALERGRKAGLVNNHVHPKQSTMFILSGYWGIRNLGKLANSRSVYLPYLRELKHYLEQLK